MTNQPSAIPSSWQSYLEQNQAHYDAHGALRYVGLDPQHAQANAWQALQQGRSLLVPLLRHTPLQLRGDDRLDFLHGQVSNDVKGLTVGGCNRALMLNIKGHALALLSVYRREDDVFVAVEDGAGELTQKQLQAHIIFDQVSIHNLQGTLLSLSLQGQNAASVLRDSLGCESLPSEGSFLHCDFASAKLLIAPRQRSRYGGYDLHVLSQDAAALCEQLQAHGAQLAGEAVLDIARVEAGIANVANEAAGGILPQEAGLEPAISYRKGCYLGQEIMARIEARGNVRRSLVGLRLSTMPDTHAPDIHAQGKRVGQLGTVLEHPDLGVIALAVLRNDVQEGLEVNGIPAERQPLPFVKTDA